MQPLGGPCRVATEWADVNSGITYTERVQGDPGPLTLLGWYVQRHATSAPEEEWRASILAGQCSINGRVERDPDALIPPNAMLEHRRPGWREPDAPAFLDVLWWDAHVVAVHKPSGLQVLPAGPFHERCALTLLRRFHAEHAGELAGAPAPVHRLGRGTSGVLICACSPEARRKLSRDFVEHGGPNSGCLRKVYRTLVQGLMAADEGDVDAPIGRMPYPEVRGGLFAACPPDAPGAKPSRSHYSVLHRDAAAGTTLADVEIFTGRPHQIRIHMAAAGHPLVGDPLYAPGGQPWPVAAAASGSRECAAAGAAAPGGCGTRGEGAAAAAAGEQAQTVLTAATAGAGRGEGDAAAAGAAALQAQALDGAASPAAVAEQQANGSSSSSGRGGIQERPRAVMPGDCGYLLHSMVLEFTHPISGQRVVATCEPPPPLRLPPPV